MNRDFHGWVAYLFCFVLAGCVTSVNSSSFIKPYHIGESRSFPSNRIVLIGGCFDVLHYGHIEFLRKAKEQGDYLIVALEPDETIINHKKRKPIHTQEQRAHNLAAIRYVDEVLLLPKLNGFKDYNQLVQDIHPAVIATTAGDPQLENKKRQANSVGGKVEIVVAQVDSFSTSNIIQALSD